MRYRVVLTLVLSLCVAGCGYKTDLSLPEDDAQARVDTQMPVSEKYSLL